MSEFLSQSQHSSPWRRHVSRIKVVFLHLGEGLLSLSEPKALPACDSSFVSARVFLHPGKGIHLGEGCLHLSEPKAWTLLFFSFASARLLLCLEELIHLGEGLFASANPKPLEQVLLSCSFCPLLCLLYFQYLQNSHR